MRFWNLFLLAELPEKIVPEEIHVPGYFLEAVNTTGGIWSVRILCALLFLLIVFGCFYYEKKASKEEEKKGGKE